MARLSIPRTTMSRLLAQTTIPGASWAALLAADGGQLVSTAREVLLLRNPTAGAIAGTVLQTPDAWGLGTTLPFSVPASGVVAIPLFKQDGWMQADGNIYVDVAADGLLGTVIAVAAGGHPGQHAVV